MKPNMSAPTGLVVDGFAATAGQMTGDPTPGEITQLLIEWKKGNREAFQGLIPLVYEELRRIARHKLQQFGAGGALQATELVQEAYLKFVAKRPGSWRNRAHFYAIAANTIRRILVEDYRRRMANKRGGKTATRVSFAGVEVLSDRQQMDFVALHEALEKLETLDERAAKIIELRFFSGLNHDEIAAVLEISRATVEREWRSAKAWLYSQLADPKARCSPVPKNGCRHIGVPLVFATY